MAPPAASLARFERRAITSGSVQPPSPLVNPTISIQDRPPAPDLVDTDIASPLTPGPSVLARKRTAAPKPTPTPTPAPDAPAAAEASAPSAAAAAPSAAPRPAAVATPVPAAASPAAAATPSPDPASPAFLQKYEAAYIKFLERDYVGAKSLLTEADAIQANQPASIDLRTKIFSYYYKIAYAKYSDKDYAGAQTALDDADAIQKDQPDSLNLRGLIFSRQRVFDQAEVMFKKAIQADPTFWAAKFNMAELPFTYKNYTVARSRYEELLAETDAKKQPREAELTQFKVFLTLLLEGKESAARAFMDHFSFTGATPARYYCEAALEFYAGNTDKAAEAIATARKEYPSQIEAIFADSFYRVGWLTDPNKAATGNSAVAAASPSPSPSPAAAGASPSTKTASAAAVPSPTPMVMAAASPTVTPVLAAAVATATPKPAAIVSASPAPAPTKLPTAVASAPPSVTPTKLPIAAANVTPTALPASAVASASPTKFPVAVASTSPVPTRVVTPAPATPAPSVAIAAVSPSPRPTAVAIVTRAPTPTPAVAVAAPSASPSPTVEPSASPSVAEKEEAPQMSQGEDIFRLGILAFIVLSFVTPWVFVFRRAAAIRQERRKPALHYGGGKKARENAEASSNP